MDLLLLKFFHPLYYNKMFLLRDKLTKDERDQPEEEAKVHLKVKLLFSDSGTADLIMWRMYMHAFCFVY